MLKLLSCLVFLELDLNSLQLYLFLSGSISCRLATIFPFVEWMLCDLGDALFYTVSFLSETLEVLSKLLRLLGLNVDTEVFVCEILALSIKLLDLLLLSLDEIFRFHEHSLIRDKVRLDFSLPCIKLSQFLLQAI